MFDLTSRQAKNMKVAANRMHCIEAKPRIDWGPAPVRVFQIDNFAIDERRQLVLNAPITGRCSYAFQAHFQEPVAVNLYFDLGGERTFCHWHYPPEGLSHDGMLDFKFEPADPTARHPKPWIGTTTAFLRLSTERKPPRHAVPLSNTCALLVDVIG